MTYLIVDGTLQRHQLLQLTSTHNKSRPGRRRRNLGRENVLHYRGILPRRAEAIRSRSS